jgi:O-antigen ligase
MVLDRARISLNAVAFECIFAYVSGMCLLRSNRLLWFLGAVLFLICSTLTGSRAPTGVVILGGVILLAFNALQSRSFTCRMMGWTMIAVLAVGTVAAIIVPTAAQRSAFTEERSDLWAVAFHKFEQRPVLGFGYLAVQDDPSYIPGGYHNEYVTALAEQGVFGFAVVIMLFWFIFRCCWKLAYDSFALLPQRQWVMFGCLALLIHALIETSGLFGDAQGPVDFLAYIFLAIVIAQMSRQESLPTEQTARWRMMGTLELNYMRRAALERRRLGDDRV